MKEGKHTKQIKIGSFFQKEKEPSLWTAIDDNSAEQKKKKDLLPKKVKSGKPTCKFKAMTPETNNRSDAVSRRFDKDLIAKTPDTGPSRKSLLSQKTKVRLSLAGKSGKTNEYFKNKKDIICIGVDAKADERQGKRTDSVFKDNDGIIKTVKLKSVENLFKEDGSIQDASGIDSRQNPSNRNGNISYEAVQGSNITTDKDFAGNGKPCSRSAGNPLFTRVRPKRCAQTSSSVPETDGVRQNCSFSSRKDDDFEEMVENESNNGSSFADYDCMVTSLLKDTVNTTSYGCQDSEFNTKTFKLKLKRLDNKRVFRSGSSGVSPMKKRQAKDSDIEGHKATEMKCRNKTSQSSPKHHGSMKEFGKRHLFSEEISTESNLEESFEDINISNNVSNRNSPKQKSNTARRENRVYSVSNFQELEDDDIVSQYLDESSKVAKKDTCSTSSRNNSRSFGVNASTCYTKDQNGNISQRKVSVVAENENNCAVHDALDLSTINLDDSFQLSNCEHFADDCSASDKPNVHKMESSRAPSGICNKESNSEELLNQSFLDISFGEDFEVAQMVETRDVTVKPVLVLEVTRQDYHDGSSGMRTEKAVRLFDEETSTEAVCLLRQDWESMEIFPGDSVYITGFRTSQESSVILDNNSSEFVTLFPNTLVSGTTISMGITCQRRAVISELFKTEGPNQAMFLGTFMHELFDFVIDKKVFDVNKLEKKATNLLLKYENLNTLYNIGMEETDFMEKIKEFLPHLSTWARKFLKDQPQSSDDVVDFKLGSDVSSDNITRLAISNIVDIEENIICPTLGLKGKVDASVNVTIQRQPKVKRKNQKKCEIERFHVPFELKTGKMFSKLGSIEHRAQVILYSLMMSEKYDKKIDAGLLYYMKAGHLQGVPATQKEKRALIMKRNEIVRYLSMENLRNKKLMPGLLKDAHGCKWCPVVNNCMVYHKAIEEGSEETSGVGEQFEELTGHMTEEELHYFFKWYHLIMLEAQEEASSSGQKKIWMKTSDALQSIGKCFSQMLLKSEAAQGDQASLYAFERSNAGSCKKTLKQIMINVGDRVTISEENCKTFGVTTGLVKSVSEDEISVFCNEKIKARGNINTTLFRIEKDESLTSYKIPLGNLMKLFSSKTEFDKKIKQLIVSLSTPQFSWFDFKSFLTTEVNENQHEVVLMNKDQGQTHLVTQPQMKTVRSVFSGLNPDQKQAVEKCLTAQDYVMILGMPGTGKTTTIACIVKTLVALGKTVLITSYTHSAVDNILLKLKQMNLDFLRLGQAHKIHKDIQPYSIEETTKAIKTVKGLERFYDSKKIVATTCLGVNHPLFLKKRFDYCVVDEASQITQPVCIGAIRCADVFVLVGDHYQLPPLVQSVEAKNGGMDESLFKRLSGQHPSAVVSLQYQYRMHKDIMALANVLIYDQRMQCGTEIVENELLKVPKWDHLKSILRQNLSQGSFISNVLKPSQPVVFVDTDSVPFLESQTDNHISNPNEADLVANIFRALTTGAVKCREIGIVSPYRHQLKVIKDALTKYCAGVDLANVEINTIDKYQGRDKSCIIVSFVRSNDAGRIGTLLKDWRRINVAITRAKHKLILIGSVKTLSSSPVLKKLIDFAIEKKWVVKTPSDIFL